MAKVDRPDISIRPYGERDFSLLQRLLGDPVMTVYLGGPETPEALLARHRRYLSYDGSREGLFTVLGPHDTPVGWVGYWESPREDEAIWECGWSVLPEYQGKGVATAAVALLLDRAKRHGLHRYVYAFPSVDNAPSNALCRRLGFELLGEAVGEYPKGKIMHSFEWRFDLEGDVGSGSQR